MVKTIALKDAREQMVSMTLEDRIDGWERRQEAIITALDGILNVVETIRDSQVELAKWLATPPSSELPEVLKQLIASNNEVSELMLQLGARMNRLPAAVARAVLDGEAR